MQPAALVALVGLAAGALAVVAMYNKLVVTRNRIHESWSNVDTELKRRHDLVPNLVEVVKGYAAHERDTLELLARVRSLQGVDTEERRAAEAGLARETARLLAVAEAHPGLKASEQYARLQRALVDTEDRIQAARRFYNGNVRDYNNRVEQIPSAWVARGFGFRTHAYFELPALEQRAAPELRF